VYRIADSHNVIKLL